MKYQSIPKTTIEVPAFYSEAEIQQLTGQASAELRQRNIKLIRALRVKYFGAKKS